MYQNINMKSLNKLKEMLSSTNFDLDYEAQMVQSRILSTILEIMEEKEVVQSDLEKLTGLSQPFLSSVLNNRKNLSMKHIALFQRALGIVLQPPEAISNVAHKAKFYNENDESLKAFYLKWQHNYTEASKLMEGKLQFYDSVQCLNEDDNLYVKNRRSLGGLKKWKQTDKPVRKLADSVNVYGY